MNTKVWYLPYLGCWPYSNDWNILECECVFWYVWFILWNFPLVSVLMLSLRILKSHYTLFLLQWLDLSIWATLCCWLNFLLIPVIILTKIPPSCETWLFGASLPSHHATPWQRATYLHIIRSTSMKRILWPKKLIWKGAQWFVKENPRCLLPSEIEIICSMLNQFVIPKNATEIQEFLAVVWC